MIWKRTVALLFVAALWLCAADFWHKKKYTVWSQKEAQQMMRDSPWARPVSVRLETGGGRPMGGGGGGRAGRGGGGARGGGAIADASMGAGGGMAGGGIEGAGGPSRGGGLAAESDPSMTVTVCWHSSLPVKQAVARLKFGEEVETSPDAARMLARQETHYIIGVLGLPAMAMRAKPDQIKANAFLKVKGKDSIPAENVQAGREQRNVNLFLLFPHSPIEVSDQEVELSLKLGNINITRKFKLKDMVLDGKLQL